MTQWQPIETAPRDGRHILLKYWKGSTGSRQNGNTGEFITEGYFEEETKYTDTGRVPTHSGYGSWMDYTNRLIEAKYNSTKSKNEVVAWMELPK